MSDSDKPKKDDEFLKQASGKQTGLVSEFIGFLKANKKWWLAPHLLDCAFLCDVPDILLGVIES